MIFTVLVASAGIYFGCKYYHYIWKVFPLQKYLMNCNYFCSVGQTEKCWFEAKIVNIRFNTFAIGKCFKLPSSLQDAHVVIIVIYYFANLKFRAIFLRSKLLLWHKSLQWFCNVFWRWHDYCEGCWTFYKAYEIKNYANQNHSVSMCIKFHFKAWIFWHFWQAACSKRLSEMTVEARTHYCFEIYLFFIFFFFQINF